MKLTKTLIFLSLLFVYSCAGSPADKETIKKLYYENYRSYLTWEVLTGEKVHIETYNISKYRQLEQQGYLELDSIGMAWRNLAIFSVAFTDKAKPFMEEKRKVKISNVTVTDVIDIKKDDKYITAGIIRKDTDLTPFYILYDTVPHIDTLNVILYKRENKWFMVEDD